MTTPWKRGDKMPQTPEEFQRMGDLYEKVLLDWDKERTIFVRQIHKLQVTIDKLQRRLRRKNDTP